MRILEGPDVDLISPFPASALSHLVSWLRSYKNIIETDLSPRTPEAIHAHYAQALTVCHSYGVIDRANALGFRHDCPIIGMVLLEPTSPYNANLYVASNRRAWKSGFMEQAVNAAVGDVFEHSHLLRLSVLALDSNGPMRSLASRLKCKFEGVFADMTVQAGQPRSIVQYGLTKCAWEKAKG